MSVDRPAKLIDPVCGMTVDVARADANDLLLEHAGRWYAFCRSGCRRAFQEDPTEYVAAAEQATAEQATAEQAAARAAAPTGQPVPAMAAGQPVIDEGMRRWYESCSCCLGDAYPEIKAQLDAERAAANAAPVAVGICEVAEAEAAAAE